MIPKLLSDIEGSNVKTSFGSIKGK